jgi:hypothetical protein
MDPDACWARLLDALRAGDVLEMIDAAVDLGAWLNKGGAFPELDPPPTVHELALVASVAATLETLTPIPDSESAYVPKLAVANLREALAAHRDTEAERATERHVWAVLSTIMALDPDDSLRDQIEEAELAPVTRAMERVLAVADGPVEAEAEAPVGDEAPALQPAEIVDKLHALGLHELSAAVTRERLELVRLLAESERLRGELVDTLESALAAATEVPLPEVTS